MATKTFTNPGDEAWDVNLAWENTEVDGNGDLAVAEFGLEFDGEGDRVDVDPFVPQNSDFTFSLWLDIPVGAAADDTFYSQGDGTGDRTYFYSVTEFGDATNSVRVWDSGLGQIVVGNDNRGSGPVYTTVVRDGDTWRLYENAVEVDSTTLAGSLASATGARFGAGEDSSGSLERFYEGRMRGINYWSEARSQAQIEADMDADLDGTETNLVHLWRADEGSGTTLGDSAGTNDGTIIGASWPEGWRASNGWDPALGTTVDSSEVSWTATGDASGEVAVSDTDPTSPYFDGVDDEGSVASDPALSGFADFTIGLWVMMPTYPTDDSIIYLLSVYKIEDDERGWGIVIRGESEPDSGLGLNLSTDGSDFLPWYTGLLTETLPNGQWNHIVFRRINDTITVFVNNVNEGTHTEASTLHTSAADLGFARRDGSSTHLECSMNDARIYSRGLSDQEVADWYNQEDVSNTNLEGHWRFLDGSGSTATDSSGNNRDATLVGTTWQPGESGYYRPATNGQPIPGVSQGDDLSGKKLYGRQLLNDGAATMQSFTLQVSTAAAMTASRRMRSRMF